ncbi:MAG: hypothetical protein M1830_009879 [Pleopsidium flavum]|nr:MAG: hypothetical protein M1830_010073 [Pleopsidium flavum]KAI9879010.1 MAG: hypothetical protein M1830_009879 [Pleopsidium flavum]
MEAAKGEITGASEDTNTGQLLGLGPTSGGQGMEALKDIAFGSVRTVISIMLATHIAWTPVIFVMNHISRTYTNLYIAQTAGIIGKYIEYPFDTVKVRLQSQPDHLPLRYDGPLDCFRQSYRHEGFRGLYRGVSAPLVGAAIETSSLFFSYRLAQEALQATMLPRSSPLPLQALVVCGAASGALTSLLLTPIELIKCKMQVPVSSHSRNTPAPGPLALVVAVYRHHGILGFWHGQLGTLIRETGGSAAWFGSYEAVSALLRNYNHGSSATKDDSTIPIYQQMLAGATAGVSYNFVFYPADTIKSRMQTEEVSELTKGGRGTFLAVGRALWRKQGLKGLYRGCGITVGRAAPSSAFIFAVYEGLREWFG